MNTSYDFWIEKIYAVRTKLAAPSFSFNTPSRPWYGFVLCVSGHADFYDGRQKRYSIERGDAIFLSKGTSYSVQMSAQTEYITTALDLTFAGTPIEFPFAITLTDDERDTVYKLSRLFEKRPHGYLTEGRILLTRLYASVMERHSEKKGGEPLDDAELARECIERSFRESISISEIATRCRRSPSYLRARFLKRYGISMSRYREQLRIDEAKTMLMSGLFEIKAVAKELGYCDIYHFSKNFKLATGISPRDYKKSFDTNQ